MNQSISLLRRMARNVRWYFADVLTGITGKGTLHFTYGVALAHEQDSCSEGRSNPGTGLPMLSAIHDVHGNRWGAAAKE